MNLRLIPLLLLFLAPRTPFASPTENVRAHNPIVSHISREPVSSSAIASIGYSRGRHLLEVEFGNGRIYRYLEVPPSVFRELINADSKARFYDKNIKGHYASLRVLPRVKDRTD